MKRAKTIIYRTAVLFLFTYLTVIHAERSEAKRDIQEDPENVAKHYFDAYLSKDVSDMMKYSLDENYLDEPSRKRAYEKDSPIDTITEFKIISFSKVNEDKYNLSVQLTYSDIGTLPPITYSIVKQDNSWKLLLKPIEINMNKNSPDYGQIKEGTPAYKIQYTDS